MKDLPNGNQAFYREGGVWSLIGGLCLLACMIIAYFAIGFYPNERWFFFVMAAAFAVMVIMLLKNFFTHSTLSKKYFPSFVIHIMSD